MAAAMPAGWPAGSLHLERFAPKPQREPVRKDAFDVVLRGALEARRLITLIAHRRNICRTPGRMGRGFRSAAAISQAAIDGRAAHAQALGGLDWRNLALTQEGRDRQPSGLVKGGGRPGSTGRVEDLALCAAILSRTIIVREQDAGEPEERDVVTGVHAIIQRD